MFPTFEFTSNEAPFGGEVTVGSMSFGFQELPDMEGIAGVIFRLSSFTIPVVGPVPPSTLTIIVPFTAVALVDSPPFPPFEPALSVDMSGQGLATLNLGLAPSAPVTYVLQNAHFEFTPEPATILLSCIGLLGLTLLRRRTRCIPLAAVRKSFRGSPEVGNPEG
jgi:hypothetical protein